MLAIPTLQMLVIGHSRNESGAARTNRQDVETNLMKKKRENSIVRTSLHVSNEGSVASEKESSVLTLIVIHPLQTSVIGRS